MHSAAVILAAGQGTRMKSATPKVAHKILGESIVSYVVRAATAAGVGRLVTVVGHGEQLVRDVVSGTEFVRQDAQLGTGHAVMCAEPALAGFEGSVVVLSGDVPLIRPETIRSLLDRQQASGAACVLLSVNFPNPTGYGRIVRDADGSVSSIVEHKDLAPEQYGIQECNVGVYCFDATALFRLLKRIEPTNAQGEYYLTDVIGLLKDEDAVVEAVLTDDVEESNGINDRIQLAAASRTLQHRINTHWMAEGVTMIDPELVWIGPKVTLGNDVELWPMTFLMGDISVASGSVIGPDVRLTDVVVGRDVRLENTVLRDTTLEDGTTISAL